MPNVNSFNIAEQHRTGVPRMDAQGLGARVCEMAITYPNGKPLFTVKGVDCSASEEGPQGVGHRMALSLGLREVIGAVSAFAGGNEEQPSEAHTVVAYDNVDALRQQPHALRKVAETLGWVGYCAVLKGENALVPPFEVEPMPSVAVAQLAGELPLHEPRLAHMTQSQV